MYTHPTTAEQCLHNALKIVHAMRYAGMDYDVQVKQCVLCIESDLSAPLASVPSYLCLWTQHKIKNSLSMVYVKISIKTVHKHLIRNTLFLPFSLSTCPYLFFVTDSVFKINLNKVDCLRSETRSKNTNG